MVIQNSVLSMGAKSYSASFSSNSAGYAGWGDRSFGSVLQADNIHTPATDGFTEKDSILKKDDVSVKECVNEKDEQKDSLLTTDGNGNVLLTETIGNADLEIRYPRGLFETDDYIDFIGNAKIEHDSMKNLFGLMSNHNLENSKKMTTFDLFELLLGNFRERLNNLSLGRSSRMNTDINGNMTLGSIVNNIGGIAPTQSWNEEYYSCELYTESEKMTYSTMGKVETADGREIDINVQAVMTQSFTEYSELKINYRNYDLIDPLIINLDGGTAQLSDQKFLFDIDMDGEDDNISLLAKGCGYLALDMNEDGIINDGSELFGAKTGNGFEELAVFDLDGNGWIDENDEVFNRLRIWTKDDAGNDRLVALGVAGVGAIYLGNTDSEFTQRSMEDNSVLGKVTRSGIFLKESGECGIIQQMDVAKQKSDVY